MFVRARPCSLAITNRRASNYSFEEYRELGMFKDLRMFKQGDCYMSLSYQNKQALKLRRAIAALCMAGAALQTSHALAADAAPAEADTSLDEVIVTGSRRQCGRAETGRRSRSYDGAGPVGALPAAASLRLRHGRADAAGPLARREPE